MFKKVKSARIFEVVAEQIEEAIIAGRLKPGDKLPAERTLTKDFGISRRTLREAMRVLQQKGLIEIKTGTKGGAFIRELTTDNVTESIGLLIRSRKVSLHDLVEFRSDIETTVTSKAAQRATKSDRERLRALITEVEGLIKEGKLDWESFMDIDRRIHKAIASAARNIIHESVLNSIHDNLFHYFESYLPQDDESVMQSIKDMMKIVKAIENGDAKMAFNLSLNHVERGFKQMDRKIHQKHIA